ncbi:MAG TPA: alpha/beta hydrolase [Terriglobales bacterium]|nr:alpha/beta hydrolase [Terriglobales bacterium]
MSFEDLPPLRPALTPGGRSYATNVTQRSRPILKAEAGGHLDCAYGADYWQKVDVFPPEGAGDSLVPILLFAHGGSWISGCKEWMAFMAPVLRKLPLLFVSVSYRLAPASRFPEPLEDCAEAVRWIYEHASSWQGDRSRIFVGGHSAGGHLMSLLALQPHLLHARALPQRLIKGCFAVSTPFGIRASDTAVPSEILELSRQAILRDSNDAADASPLAHVSGNAPKFLITIGENDFPFIREQAPVMQAALEAAGNEVYYQDLADHDHFATSERCVNPGHPWLGALTEMIGLTNRQVEHV